MAKSKNHPHVEFVRGPMGQWHWRVRAANGEMVAHGETYATESDARRGWSDARRSVIAAGAEPSERIEQDS